MLINKRILIIDDSPTIHGFLQNMLVNAGAVVVNALSGEEGLIRHANGQHYDLILLDLNLPDMEGLQVLERLRKDCDQCSVAVLTGSGGAQLALAAVRAGADGYIEKQDMLSSEDPSAFYYIFEQALEHRAGLIAQKQLEKIRADFYAMVTHDLRNPASSILMATQMLLTGLAGDLAPEQEEVLKIADSAVHTLLRLINDYLDFAKIDAGYLRLNIRETELGDIIKTSVRLAELQAHANKQILTLDLPAKPVLAWVDPERLEQVLDNLISNSVKYTPAGGQISVQLRIEGEKAVFRVSDTGIGIAKEQQKALFTKYHRVPGEATRGIRGSGLGLLIVKEIVNAHKGDVQVDSEGIPGMGTIFTVTIPLVTVPGLEPSEDQPTEVNH